MSSYASVSQFLARYDARMVRQLSSDGNNDVLNSDNVQASLDDATAEILTAILQGSIYTADQAAALVSSGDTMLVRLCCDLAMRNMAKRRGSGVANQLNEQLKQSIDLLELIRKGGRVLNVNANRSGDVPLMVNISADQSQNIGSLGAIAFFGGATATPTIYGNQN